jgi:hypothetical protein
MHCTVQCGQIQYALHYAVQSMENLCFGGIVDTRFSIGESRGLVDFRDVAAEARTFLSMPAPEPKPKSCQRPAPASNGSPEAARRLFAMSQPISETIVEAYLLCRNGALRVCTEPEACAFLPR